ncbi:MAG: iron ABC transporter permease [Bacteroidales bacterium]|nr:iron ABC transporter permease [Bacteroidales bacterium]
MILLLMVVFVLDIFLGSVSLHPSEVIRALSGNSRTGAEMIIMEFRLPKAFTALLVGMALSVSGLQMQTLFRNPLAGPYVLGVSSGASLGVAFVILGFSSGMTMQSLQGLGNWLITVAAWTGAGIVMMLILVVSSRIRDIMTMLILGIMLSGGISAVVTIMQYFSNETMLKAYIIWTMGSLGNLSAAQLKILALSVTAGLILALVSVRMLNVLLLGENYAGSMGLNIKFSRALIFITTSLLAGSVTAFCGPVGFIGIAVPHIVRNIFRTSDHSILLPGTLLTGGIVMLISDIVSQLPGSDTILPINSVTSLIGIPVVIWVIMRNRHNSSSF